jgi:Na+:H+ antiporter, NhaA family
VGGVVIPAIVFLLIAGVGQARSGWPIPTATDIAFALGVLAIVGKGLPDRIRALLLALAVIDDLIAIVIIAVVFPGELEPVAFLVAIPVVLVFGALSYRVTRNNRAWMIPTMILLALIAWALVAVSGIHPTIAGVALGLALSSAKGEPVRFALEPWSNAVILPLFAFTATLVVIPDVTQTPLGPVFWAILIALPFGKIVGITGGALIARSAMGRNGSLSIPVLDLLAVAALGGIGFTFSLLMNELAFDGSPTFLTEGTLGVLAGSLLAIVIGGTYTALRARAYRKP